mgnify:CR=1 FL=1
MSLYKDTDIDELRGKWSDIMNEVKSQKLKVMEPSLEEMKAVHNIILDYLRDNKRKLYGGYALNLLVKSINPDDAIYKPDDVPDIDFYSPDPIVDLIKLCNILHEKGFKSVVGREAMHQETYSITVNFVTYCDISYVPKIIYDRMPFKKENELMLIHPHFMMIDYIRMMSDPLVSYWRFENDLKSFKRYVLLQKHYPFPSNASVIPDDENSPDIDKSLNTVFDFIKDKQDIIVIGFYAYNYYINESNMSRLKTFSVPYYEFVSVNYRDDCLNLIKNLENLFPMAKNRVSYVEHYPFFQFTGHSVDIFVDNELVARIYTNNNKCLPYIDVPTLEFTNKGSNKINKSMMRLGTFPVTLMFGLISIMRARTVKNENDKSLYYSFVSHLIEARNHYFSKKKTTFLDDTIFREFIVNCIGNTMLPDRQRRLLIESRKKKNKKYTFVYEPADGVKEPESNYIFANSSGNSINNPRNLRLSGTLKEDDIEGDFDDEDAQKK